MPLSVVCLLFSAVLLMVQMFGSDRVAASADSPLMVPPVVSAEWERQNDDKSWANSFGNKLPELPE